MGPCWLAEVGPVAELLSRTARRSRRSRSQRWDRVVVPQLVSEDRKNRVTLMTLYVFDG